MDKPFQNLAAERGYLGCALLDSNLVPKLKLDLLHDVRHQDLVLILRRMMESGSQICILTVSTLVIGSGEAEKIGGVAYLQEILDATPSSANFEFFEGELEDSALLRRLAIEKDTLGADLLDRSKTPLEILDCAESRILALRPKSANRRKTKGELITDIANDLEEAMRNPGRLQGLATGFQELDEVLWGLKPGQLVVVGGRPGQGKSAIMLQMAYNAARAGKPTAYISLEMGAKELMFRLQCSCSGVESGIARKGVMKPEEQARFLKVSSELCRVPIHFEDGDVHTMDRITPIARQFLKDEKVELIVVDYLQLIQSSNRRASRDEGISEVSASLKQLARGLGVPIVVGSQFSRDVEREGRKPRLSDLRDSGSIEQDADIVLLLHQRPEDGAGYEIPTEVLIGKHRGGRVGTVNLVFQKNLTRFK